MIPHRRHVARTARRMAAVLAALAVATPLLAGCGSSSSGSAQAEALTGPTITIGIAYDEPFVAFERSGAMSGVDVDVAEYVANRLGYAASQITWRQVNVANRDELLNDGDVNIIVGVPYFDGDETEDAAGATPSASAGPSPSGSATTVKGVELSNAYIHMDQRLLVRGTDRDAITGVEDLKGRVVCTARGHAEPTAVQAVKGAGAEVLETDSYAECVTALVSGSADAVEGDGMVLAGFRRNLGADYLAMTETALSTVDWGVAVPEGDWSLQRFVNDALQRMVDDGSWDGSVARNFSGSDYEVLGAIDPSEG